MKNLVTTIILSILLFGNAFITQAQTNNDLKRQAKTIQKTLPQQVAPNIEFSQCLYNSESEAITFICTLTDAINEQSTLPYYQTIYSNQQIDSFLKKLITITKQEISQPDPIILIAQTPAKEIIWQNSYIPKEFNINQLTIKEMDQLMSNLAIQNDQKCPMDLVSGLMLHSLKYNTYNHTLTFTFIIKPEFEASAKKSNMDVKMLMNMLCNGLLNQKFIPKIANAHELGLRIKYICNDPNGNELFTL